jgi:cytochrome P450 family 135
MVTEQVLKRGQERLRRTRPVPRSQRPRIARGQLPPGPRWPSFFQTIGLLRLRHRFVPWVHRRYGDVFTLRIMPNATPMVFFTRPDDIKELFAADPEVFNAGKANALLGPMLGERSMLLLDGGDHLRARKLVVPAFNGRALRGYRELVAEVTREELDSWRPGVPFRSLDRMNALTLDVILRVVFGLTDAARLARMRPLVNEMVDADPVVLMAWSWPVLQRTRAWKRSVAATFEADELLYAEIADRRQAADLATRTDVLSRLLRVEVDGDRLTDEELRDQLVTLLLAGHETTATVLGWVLYELGRNRDQLAQARRAAVEGDDGWLEAVVKEALRLHPVVPLVARQLSRPAAVGAHRLPAGATAAVSIMVSHARDDNFAHPEQFMPNRFVADDVPAPHVWVPFGGGARRCLGAGFSLMEAVVVLREVLSRFEVATVAQEKPQVRNVISFPGGGATIIATESPGSAGNIHQSGGATSPRSARPI